MTAKIIAGFPGVGKTNFYSDTRHCIAYDSDSTSYSWITDEDGNKVRNPEFPQNYIEHIKHILDVADYIFVSTHDVVRQALQEEGLRYILVYPDRSEKEKYLRRYKQRGSSDEFIRLMDKNWDTFLDQLEAETYPSSIKLRNGYLSDVIG